jgi:hypothetical protein
MRDARENQADEPGRTFDHPDRDACRDVSRNNHKKSQERRAKAAPGRSGVRWMHIATGEWGKREILNAGSVVTVNAPAREHRTAAIVKASPVRTEPSGGPQD